MTAAPRQTHRASLEIAAPARAVFAAFTDPKGWAAWLPPENMSARIERFDLRPGGSYRMTLIYEGTDEKPKGKSGAGEDVVEGHFVSIEPDRRLVQTVVFQSDDPAFAGAMTMTWQIEPQARGTLVSFAAENVPPGISEADHVEGMTSSLRNLAAYLKKD